MDIKTSAECDTMTAQRAHQTVFMNHTEQGEEHRGYKIQSKEKSVHYTWSMGVLSSLLLERNICIFFATKPRFGNTREVEEWSEANNISSDRSCS